MIDENEVPTSAEHLASVIQGAASGSYSAVTKSLTARLPIVQIAMLDAMATASKKSRTFILSELLEVGAEHVMGHMSKAALKKIRQEQGRRAKEMLADADATEENE
jgi:hypothetical protein